MLASWLQNCQGPRTTAWILSEDAEAIKNMWFWYIFYYILIYFFDEFDVGIAGGDTGFVQHFQLYKSNCFFSGILVSYLAHPGNLEVGGWNPRARLVLSRQAPSWSTMTAWLRGVSFLPGKVKRSTHCYGMEWFAKTGQFQTACRSLQMLTVNCRGGHCGRSSAPSRLKVHLAPCVWRGLWDATSAGPTLGVGIQKPADRCCFRHHGGWL